MEIETGFQSRFNSISIKVPTTAGTMFVAIMENLEGSVCGIQLNIGKAGGEVSTAAHAVARLCNLALDKGASVTEIIQELSNHTTDRSVVASNGTTVRSVIDGIVHALIEYNRDKYAASLKRIGGDGFSRLGG